MKITKIITGLVVVVAAVSVAAASASASGFYQPYTTPASSPGFYQPYTTPSYSPSFYQPYTTPSYSSSSSYYGQPNAAGFPKNQYVSGYVTQSGKYVSGYWRNSPTDGYPTCTIIHC